MSIQNLLNPYQIALREITGLALNSQQLQKGELFIALFKADEKGRSFIQEAIEKGARAILCEKVTSQNFQSTSFSIPLIPVENLKEKLDSLIQDMYGQPSLETAVTGVTGTSGKTTVCYLLAQALTEAGIKTGLIGTLGKGFIPYLEESALTTPDSVSLQKYLRELVQKEARAVMMEVSSHALVQERVKQIAFQSAIFTNLTQDHLDYHGSLAEYAKAKARLFAFTHLQRAIINADDPFAKVMIQATSLSVPLVLYSTQAHFPLKESEVGRPFEKVQALYSHFNLEGLRASVQTPWGEGELISSLVGHFNLSNLLAALAELCLQGVAFSNALSILSTANGAPGRMQRMGEKGQVQVIVDYSHKPDALEKALKMLSLQSFQKIWCVFGCGGERDREKRPQMGAIAARFADYIIITNDNPRRESPSQIMEEIAAGIPSTFKNVYLEPDRYQAIDFAIRQAAKEDVILIAGKGHENYQIVGEQRLSFNDFEVANALLAKRK